MLETVQRWLRNLARIFNMGRKEKHEGREEAKEKRQLDRIERKLDEDIALDKQILAGQGKAQSAKLVITPN
jgi:hypothetical protein